MNPHNNERSVAEIITVTEDYFHGSQGGDLMVYTMVMVRFATLFCFIFKLLYENWMNFRSGLHFLLLSLLFTPPSLVTLPSCSFCNAAENIHAG